MLISFLLVRIKVILVCISRIWDKISGSGCKKLTIELLPLIAFSPIYFIPEASPTSFQTVGLWTEMLQTSTTVHFPVNCMAPKGIVNSYRSFLAQRVKANFDDPIFFLGQYSSGQKRPEKDKEDHDSFLAQIRAEAWFVGPSKQSRDRKSVV